jgi:DNA-binding transcriptional LysR family regulator
MDLHGIDLNLLVAFDALMAERSVTRAGRRIGRTQPAMSAALARLRALFGDELFVRGIGGLQPTPRALDLAGPLGHALAEIQRTLDFTRHFDPDTSTASFTLALSEHPAFTILPRLLKHVERTAPGVSLRVTSFSDRDDALALLDSGQADLTIGVPPAAAPGARILSQPLFEERFVCIVRKGHPAAGRAFGLDAFLRLSHLLVSPERERFGHVDVALAKLGRKRRLAITLSQMYAAPKLVAESDLVATLMAGVVSASGWEKWLHILKPPVALAPVPFAMFWHRRNDAHPAQAWLRDSLVALFRPGRRPSA